MLRLVRGLGGGRWGGGLRRRGRGLRLGAPIGGRGAAIGRSSSRIASGGLGAGGWSRGVAGRGCPGGGFRPCRLRPTRRLGLLLAGSQ